MNKHEKEALSGLCRIEIRRWQSVPDKQYMVDLLEIALKSLTDEPVKMPDRKTEDDFYGSGCLNWVAAMGRAEGWNACRAEVLRLNAIDSTAQQYETRAKEDKC